MLAGQNGSYLGTMTINGGTLSVAADLNLGHPTDQLLFGGGTLQTTGSFSMGRITTLNAGGGTFDTAPGTALTHGGVIAGVGGLTKTGTGTLILARNRSCTRAAPPSTAARLSSSGARRQPRPSRPAR